MAYTILENSTTADALEVRANFEYCRSGDFLPMGVTAADDLTATTSVYDLGSSTYKWADCFLSGSLTCQGLSNAGSMYVAGALTVNATTTVNGMVDKVVDIGDWNMPATLYLSVAHGLADHKKIRSIFITIRDDADAYYYDFTGGRQAVQSGYIGTVTSTEIKLFVYQTATSIFDNVNFDSTGYNRGYIYIKYAV